MSMTIQSTGEILIPTQRQEVLPKPLDPEIVGGFAITQALDVLPDSLIGHVDRSFAILRAKVAHPANDTKKTEFGQCLAYTMVDLFDEASSSSIDTVSSFLQKVGSRLGPAMEGRKVESGIDGSGRTEIWRGYDIRSKYSFSVFGRLGRLVLDDASIISHSAIWSLKAVKEPPSIGGLW